MLYKLNDKNPDIEMLQKALNELMGKELVTDGHFGALSVQAWRDYQAIKLRSRVITDDYKSEDFPELWNYMNRRFLSNSDVVQQAKDNGIDPAMLFAIRDVEGQSDGFLSDGRPLILFERHKFYKALEKKFGSAKAVAVMTEAPLICHPKWDPSVYKGYKREYDRLNYAITFDRGSALLSASWGMFQIMGGNYEMCGYKNVEAFVKDMYESEDFHLMAVIKFIKAQPRLIKAIKDKNFAEVARIYNGPGYAKNAYDKKLANAYKLYAK